MQNAELSQVLETNARSPPNLLKGGNPYLLFYLYKSHREKNSIKCRSLICHISFTQSWVTNFRKCAVDIGAYYKIL